jgi:GNAT superfamily N-acetyltransferase
VIRIEPATARDHDTFVELDGVVPALHAAAHPDLFKRDVVLRPAGSPSSSRGRASLWLAYDCDRAVGYLYTEHKHRAETRFQHAPPSSTSITSRARGGIGTALLQHARDLTRDLGVRRIELDVSSFNADARRLFASAGFRVFNEKLAVTW